jgi:hypothetical protein
MMLSIVTALYLLLVPQDLPDSLNSARGMIRQGRLTAAQEQLIGLGALPDAWSRASRELLLGNIAYERGGYELARSRYIASLEFMMADDEGAADPRVAVAESNLELVEAQISRAVDLDSAASRLRGIVGALLATGALGVAGLYLGSRGSVEPKA